MKLTVLDLSAVLSLSGWIFKGKKKKEKKNPRLALTHPRKKSQSGTTEAAKQGHYV